MILKKNYQSKKLKDMEQLTDNILSKYGTFKDNHYCIWSPDLKFRLYIKRVDNTKFSVTMDRNNGRMFLRYISILYELQSLFLALTGFNLNCA
jgi:hypothetical protein